MVSIARIRNDNIGYAVEQAPDLIGGVRSATEGRDRIMLKPNLVSASPTMTTKPGVVQALARLMKDAGKEVSIGEGSAAAEGFNAKGAEVFFTTKKDTLDGMQRHVFDELGYSDLAKSLRVPLVNLHGGDLAEVEVPNGFVYDKLSIHNSLTDIDLLCSVPMMKTHQLAVVALGMKNLIGLYSGTVYASIRRIMHEKASAVEPSGTAAPIIDMVRANKLGLVVIDGSMAMEGNGPSNGPTFQMNVIVAGTNPLATDMVAAALMGFEPNEVPTFSWAQRAGMTPTRLEEIEVRGESLDQTRRSFARPEVLPWEVVRSVWATKEV